MAGNSTNVSGAVYTAPPTGDGAAGVTLRGLLALLLKEAPLTIVRFNETVATNDNPAAVFVPSHENRDCLMSTRQGTENCVSDVVDGCDAALRVYPGVGDYTVSVLIGEKRVPITGAVRTDRGLCLQSQPR